MKRKTLRFATAVALSMLLVACESQVTLYEKLSEPEANEIYSALLSRGLAPRKISNKEGYSVTVSQDESQKSFEVLREEGLPKTRTDSLGQVFKKENMISSPLEERARYLYALSQELEKTLLTIDGVISARVHVVLPDQPAPGRPLTPSSAAVFIKHRADTDFGLYVSKVRQLVFNSIPGLPTDSPDSVSVIALPSQAIVTPQQDVEWVFGVGILRQSVVLFKILLAVLCAGILLLPSVLYIYLRKPQWFLARMSEWKTALKK
ncbi:type III secretion inner membrane ring lipoprotein SctJ [Limnobacter humi]|uniref:Lipoprotein n=1 Tax=Limnobacter humi TaxID=1778671 RepID=A0ABT1WDE6_9BURK|nr:type III secretion inner membrane ring lipoprotein SctJ [Limnobacter humi]MCQ8895545.1 type III secretion inner membrane ring lipoprotein SctJ [Limnobacter humi]